MISILAQERLLGFALGSVSMGAYVLHQRRTIYRSLADDAGSSFTYQERLAKYALAAVYFGAYVFVKRLAIQRSLADPD